MPSKRKQREFTTEDLNHLLGIGMIWPDGLEAQKRYEAIHDDHDGTNQGSLIVIIGHDGDAWVKTSGERPCETLRFRTVMGGGGSPRVRNALLLLAYALKLDNQEATNA